MGAKPQGRSGTGASRRSGSAFTAPVQRADVRDDLKNKRQNGFQFAVCSGAFDGFRQGPLETNDVDFAALFSLTGRVLRWLASFLNSIIRSWGMTRIASAIPSGTISKSSK